MCGLDLEGDEQRESVFWCKIAILVGDKDKGSDIYMCGKINDKESGVYNKNDFVLYGENTLPCHIKSPSRCPFYIYNVTINKIC